MWKAIKSIFTGPEPVVNQQPRRRPDHEQLRSLLEDVRRRHGIERQREANEQRRRISQELRQAIREPRTRAEVREEHHEMLQQHMQRAMSLEEFLNHNDERARTPMARMRTAHRAQNVFYEQPEDPQELNLEDLVNGTHSSVPMTDIIRAMALEIMTLRDEVGTLEERLETAEYYSEAS